MIPGPTSEVRRISGVLGGRGTLRPPCAPFRSVTPLAGGCGTEERISDDPPSRLLNCVIPGLPRAGVVPPIGGLGTRLETGVAAEASREAVAGKLRDVGSLLRDGIGRLPSPVLPESLLASGGAASRVITLRFATSERGVAAARPVCSLAKLLRLGLTSRTPPIGAPAICVRVTGTFVRATGIPRSSVPLGTAVIPPGARMFAYCVFG